MANKPTYQELYALVLFSAGLIDERPDYEGYAFGDSRITGYPTAKLALFFSPGLNQTQRNLPFAVGDSRQYGEGTKKIGAKGFKPFYASVPEDGKPPRAIFCGTVTPSQSAVFGQYNPIRNGHAWKYQFKYPGKGDGDGDKRDLIYGTRRKHVAGYHAGRTTLKRRSGTSGSDKLVYRVVDNDSDKIYQATSSNSTNPDFPVREHFQGGDLRKLSVVNERDGLAEEIGGLEEGLEAINQSKIEADSAFDVGELYLIGTKIYRCSSRRNEKGLQGTPYEPKESGSIQYNLDKEKEYEKDWVENKHIFVDDSEDIHDDTHCPVQKVAIGAISTTRQVDMVDLGLKSIVYRQVQGQPNVSQFKYKDIADDYAKEQQTFQPGTINSYYDRVSLFRLEVKRGNGNWTDLFGEEVFAVHGNTPQPLYNTIQIKLPGKDFYEFRFIPVCGNAWIANGNYRSKNVYWLNSQFDYTTVKKTRGYLVRIQGKEVKLNEQFNMDHKYFTAGIKTKNGKTPNQNPNSLLNDYWYFDADTTSHANEPEHQITFCNEYVENSDAWYDTVGKQYEYLAYSGLVCQSAKEISTFSNFSAYFTRGIKVERFIRSNQVKFDGTNNFPEIAYDLLTNRRYGVGEFIGNNAVDKSRFNIAAEFCYKNGFYWDGIISESVNLREFLFQQAGYQMLDFTIIGGQFSLYPSLPFKSDYSIDFGAKPNSANFPIKALFTDGNVRNFKTTFLSPEERQLFIAEVKYREEELNGFPETHVTRVRLKDNQGGYYRDPVEVFDMTQFCTSRTHAIRFAKMALRMRQTIDHSISFETTPDAAHTLAPGDYIRVGVSIQHQERNEGYTERLRTGSVAPDGTLQFNQGVPDTANDVSVYYWKPGFEEVRTGKMDIKDGRVLNSGMHGSLFTRIRAKSEARVYKIESIAYSEESFVEISGSYIPLTTSNTMKVLDWANKDFVIEDQS